MDRTEALLTRFQAEYLDARSVTLQRRKAQLKLLREFAASLEHPLEDVTPQDLNTFVGRQLQRGFHPNTVRFYLGLIRPFITWATDAQIIDPLRSMQLKSVRNPRGSGRTKPRPYTTAEVIEFRRLLTTKYPILPTYGRGSRLLMYYLHGRSHAMRRHLWRHARRLQFEAQVALALEQGLRRIEIFNLSLASMHYDNDQVVVLTAKQGPGAVVRRTVPYTSHARECVREWLDFRSLIRPPHDRPWLALIQVGGRDDQLEPQKFDTFAHSLGRAFGCHWEWHRFRHTAATEWLRAGVPLDKVSIFMGHSNLEQTRAYTQVLDSDVEEAFDKAQANFAKRFGFAA